MWDLRKYEEQIKKCSHCKFCQANCPVFLEELLETYTARARINLIYKALAEKSLEPSERFKEILDRCLLCTNCVQACPANIPAEEIVISARHLVSPKWGNVIESRFLRGFMEQRGLGSLFRKASVLVQTAGLFPEDFPKPAGKPFTELSPGLIPAEGRVRKKVAYFVGCGTNSFHPETAQDVVRVLSRNGFEIQLPEGLVCCGLPALAQGDLSTGQEMAERNFKVLSELTVDAIITDCTSCGRVLKSKLAKLFPENDPRHLIAGKIAEKVYEATDYLNQLGLASEPGSFSESFTYHIPCHRAWSPTVKNAPRELLAKVPGVRLIEMDYPERCCGAGGTFFIKSPELSKKIRARKIEDLLQTKTQIIITQCPSCRSYLSTALPDKKIWHPLSLLARAYGF